MAGLLYLPRLFVYHAEKNHIKELSETFKVMEHRLYYYIATPSLVLVWLTGLYMAYAIGLYLWLIIKFLAVIFLTIYHIILIKFLINFEKNKNDKTSKFFRMINEIPFLILLLVLIMVIIKPG